MPIDCFEILQQVQHHRLHGNVERRGRLVEDDELWMQRDRARDADAGLLAAGQLMRETVEQIDRQADQAGEFLAAGAQRVAALDVAELHDRIGDGARRGEARIEAVGRILEHHLDALAQRRAAQRPAAVMPPISSPSNMMRPEVWSSSRITIIEVVDLPQPDLADQADALAVADGEADAVDGAEDFRARPAACGRTALPSTAVAPWRGYSLTSFSTRSSGFVTSSPRT